MATWFIMLKVCGIKTQHRKQNVVGYPVEPFHNVVRRFCFGSLTITRFLGFIKVTTKIPKILVENVKMIEC